MVSSTSSCSERAFEDVKFSFERYKGAAASPLKHRVVAVDVVDARHVRFRLKTPVARLSLIPPALTQMPYAVKSACPRGLTQVQRLRA